MQSASAIEALSALAHETRLAVVLRLVKAGEAEISAGDLGRELNVVPNTMSAHLKILTRSGLVSSRRTGRLIMYSVRGERLSDLMNYLADRLIVGTQSQTAQ